MKDLEIVEIQSRLPNTEWLNPGNLWYVYVDFAFQ